MTLVIDASAAYGLLLGNQWDAVLENNSELVAPDLIVAELLNTRWKIARSGGLTPGLESILDFLGRVRIMPSLPYAAVAAELSERLKHPVYDCVYVALARQENVKLLTSDAHLARKLRSHKLSAVLA
ncbi:MAG TPA: type II toxin-antitoxin system VapC family toxin [Candidatus Baltobacteraceae bacterium]|nr:type II toxin-antitoxin system VapC family toxin [Candidatus Baltobacteraceae bacterium]